MENRNGPEIHGRANMTSNPARLGARGAAQDALLLETALASPDDIFALPKADELAPEYQSGEPYPNVVIDGFFRPEIFSAVQHELVSPETSFTKVFTDEFQTHKTISTGDAVPPLISLIATKFASAEMLRYIERVTGVKKLVPDPYFNTDYGYYHIVGSGGVLGSHVDHSRHGSLSIPHVLNLVVYLSSPWKEEDGGTLCLFDSTGTTVRKRVPCLANRAVLFSSSPIAYHAVEPVAREHGRRRHSLYFAYYSVDRHYAHSSSMIFPSMAHGRDNQDPSVSYGTYFVMPWHRLVRPANWIHLKTRLIHLTTLLLPPILLELGRKLRRGRQK